MHGYSHTLTQICEGRELWCKDGSDHNCAGWDVEGVGKLDDTGIPPRDLFIYVAIIYNLLTSEKDSSQLAKSQNTGRNPIWKFFDVKITLHKVAHPEFLA